ncbi:Diaphanous autoregulatory [Penicillium macrosclerotiorum]|uniref:Diaphanous autoregulatory n=1 Tax=Penicillium macrosclerotiorum TaxID=303699 RepID=UPI002547D597|nr:Diaphanous autoregulatory [Penicillium macrosclerotiorum]KAJ5669191.1 Diaphanous autoregulatory [Penicillium macrosclerotiorum]
MDSLLEKLRAAAPQAKDQRDRRRRARLKERHQVRVASGQKVPDFAASEEGDETDKPAEGGANVDENGLLSPPLPDEGEDGAKEQISEGEDVADRAASMLLGLRSNSDANGERQRRRRESADEERRNRRLRRRNGATTGSKDSADGSVLPTVQEPRSPSRTDSVGADDQAPPSPPLEESKPAAPPSIIVSEQHDGRPSQEPTADGSSANQPIELSD